MCTCGVVPSPETNSVQKRESTGELRSTSYLLAKDCWGQPETPSLMPCMYACHAVRQQQRIHNLCLGGLTRLKLEMRVQGDRMLL